MRSFRRGMLFVLAVMLAGAPLVRAGIQNNQGQNNNDQGQNTKPKPAGVAPEIGAAGIGGVAALLIGGTILLTVKRRKPAA